jgi:hypothetical protein
MVGTLPVEIPRCNQDANSVHEHLVVGVQGSHQGVSVLDQDRKVLFLKALGRCGAGRFDNLASGQRASDRIHVQLRWHVTGKSSLLAPGPASRE